MKTLAVIALLGVILVVAAVILYFILRSRQK